VTAWLPTFNFIHFIAAFWVAITFEWSSLYRIWFTFKFKSLTMDEFPLSLTERKQLSFPSKVTEAKFGLAGMFLAAQWQIGKAALVDSKTLLLGSSLLYQMRHS
jgi:hypothetical protein